MEKKTKKRDKHHAQYKVGRGHSGPYNNTEIKGESGMSADQAPA